ncbi:RasGEF domain-containing protein [Reticulomyxa filosa]|uniref:RasGEF domain-containing protein n=1 Tax=Reticulomyxa filosa TaxID=46433 RepID=X6MQ22_RETFI|nr:RasGEF domain-containing protein [Reticulomyxa filosa]|eukprot:ETO15756.1 RasGEF domain-containing protein [Reticulomyxa filosa]
MLQNQTELLYHWINYYPEDFADTTLLDKLCRFIDETRESTKSVKTLTRQWDRLLHLTSNKKPKMKDNLLLTSSISNLRVNPKVSNADKYVTQYRFTDSFFPPKEMVLQHLQLDHGCDLLKIQPELLADQLTLIETQIYQKIEIRELTNCAWQNCEHVDSNMFPDEDSGTPRLSSMTCPFSPSESYSPEHSMSANMSSLDASLQISDADISSNVPMENQLQSSLLQKLETAKLDAPNLLYMIDHVNRLSLWVATVILQESDANRRVSTFAYFYSVANRCLQRNNVHSATSIFAGISLAPIDRLKRVKQVVFANPKIKAYHDTLANLLSSQKIIKRIGN